MYGVMKAWRIVFSEGYVIISRIFFHLGIEKMDFDVRKPCEVECMGGLFRGMIKCDNLPTDQQEDCVKGTLRDFTSCIKAC